MNQEFVEKSEWRPLRVADKGRQREARLQAHHAVQWLARVARAYIPPQPDDGHTSLIWDSSLDAFVTQSGKSGVRLSLGLKDLTLTLFVGDGATGVQSLSLNDRSDSEARQWLGGHLSKSNLDPRALDGRLLYEIPSHALQQGNPYDSVGSANYLAELAAWFANSSLSLNLVRSQISGHKLVASPVRCWPHHFDLATLTTLPMRNSVTPGYVGVGLSPGDNYYDEPYFYVSVYPKPDPSMLPTLPLLGYWHTHEFTAAVAPAHKILAAKDQKIETDKFLQFSVEAAFSLVI